MDTSAHIGRILTSHRLILAIVASAVPAVSDAQINSSWNGTTGNWTNAALWSAGVPQNGQPGGGDTYNATVNGGGTITRDTNVIIEQLNFQRGTIAGSNSLTLNAAMTWGGGTFGGTGSVFAGGGVLLTGPSNTSLFLTGPSLTIGGSASTWTEGNVRIAGGSVLTNSAGSTLTVSVTMKRRVEPYGGSGAASFVNAGTFRVPGSLGGSIEFYPGVAFTNTGVVELQSGNGNDMRLDGGGSSTGPITVGSGVDLRFDGGSFDLTSGAGVSGSGRVWIGGGVVNVGSPYSVSTYVAIGLIQFDGGPYTLPKLEISGGTLGGAAAVTVSGPTIWQGGTFGGTGTITANGGVSIGDTPSGSALPRFLAGTSFTIGGAASSWSQGGNIYIDTGSVLTVAAGAILTVTGDNSILRSSGQGTAGVLNRGTFRKQTGTGTTLVGANIGFTNSGTVDVQSGVLQFVAGMTNTGTVSTATGATLKGPVTSNSGGVVRGVGTFDGPLVFNAGSTLHPGSGPGILTVTGPTTMSGGSTYSVELNGPAAGSGHGRLVVASTGSIALNNATLSISLGYTPAAGDRLFILSNESLNPITGTFDGIPQNGPITIGVGGLTTALVSYNGDVATNSLTGGNDVVVYNFVTVPEPTAVFGLAVVGLCGVRWCRHRRGRAGVGEIGPD